MSNQKRFEDLMVRIFDDHRDDIREEFGADEHERRRRDFAFHMTDWTGDLERMAALFQDPDRLDLEQATVFVIGFLYHVIPHLNAAGRLLLDEISDPFAEPTVAGPGPSQSQSPVKG